MIEEEEEVFKIPHDGRPALSERMSAGLFYAVHQAVGNASMCWDNIGGAGTFEVTQASEIAFELCHLIADEIEAEHNAACGYIESTITRRILDTVLNMYVSAYYTLDYAEDLLSDKTIRSKHRLEVELGTMQGLLDIAKEQLENEDLKEDLKENECPIFNKIRKKNEYGNRTNAINSRDNP
jgi:hypothetical protein